MKRRILCTILNFVVAMVVAILIRKFIFNDPIYMYTASVLALGMAAGTFVGYGMNNEKDKTK